jgi:phage antirepressor YoqD-like protein
MNIKDNNIIESTIEQKQLTQILREKVIVFSFEKDNQHLYIKHNNNLKTLIKTVIFDSDYEIVANEMYNSET